MWMLPLYLHVNQKSVDDDDDDDDDDFPYKWIGPIQMHGEANFTLP